MNVLAYFTASALGLMISELYSEEMKITEAMYFPS